MVSLTRLNHTPVLLNCELIETIESTPDSVIKLTTGQKLMVRESPDEILQRIILFRRALREPYQIPCHVAVSELAFLNS